MRRTISLRKYPVRWNAEIFDTATDKTVGNQTVYATNLHDAFKLLPDLNDSGMDIDDTTLEIVSE
ncbi:hypothetical protein ACFC1L_39975 [Streptomyces sp. NPDC056210]|uniref:hypothetical protein n=1 Tax=Streptomyces sp. NPDC056210 TaxID=3345746 RepID=UPI0035D5AADF